MIKRRWLYAFGIGLAAFGTGMIFGDFAMQYGPMYGWIVLVLGVAMIGASITDRENNKT